MIRVCFCTRTPVPTQARLGCLLPQKFPWCLHLRLAPRRKLRVVRIRLAEEGADDQGKLNPELALLKDSQTLSPLGELYVSSQSPQYAWSLEEDAGTRLLVSHVLLVGLVLAVLVFT